MERGPGGEANQLHATSDVPSQDTLYTGLPSRSIDFAIGAFIMARIKLAYIGGGSTRATGTMASFIQQGENFSGSEVVLIDLNEERLRIVQTIAQKMARARGLDLTVTITTNRREGLQGCDAVLTSFRPGGFEARYLDESIPLKYGVIGQETQGPAGFFMALLPVQVMKSIIADMEAGCSRGEILNYTNAINI